MCVCVRLCVRVCVLRGRERLLAGSTGRAGKQAQQRLSPVEDVIASLSTQAPALNFSTMRGRC